MAPRDGGQGSARREDLSLENGDQPELEHERSDLEFAGVHTTARRQANTEGMACAAASVASPRGPLQVTRRWAGENWCG